MLYQITSAMGPVECSIAVTKLYESLKKEYKSIQEIRVYKSTMGLRCGLNDIYDSVFFSCDEEIPDLCGTIKWICNSPVRPNHKRKNWFVKVSKIPELEEIDESISDKDITFTPFKSANGPGGQHVNKTESGIILTHKPTNIKITCVDERSQFMNKNIALKRLRIELHNRVQQQRAKQTNDNWKEQCSVERGNEVRTYTGELFKRIK